MLLQFAFENYKSFRDHAVLDMTADKITEHASSVMQSGREKVLPVGALFGANASGKSNVLEAFQFMRKYVIDSFSFGGDIESTEGRKVPARTPFLFDQKSSQEPSTFEVYFITTEEEKSKTYNYGFSLDDLGIAEEWLNTQAKTSTKVRRIFYRNRDELDLSGIPKKQQDNLKIALQPETLIVSLGAKLKIDMLTFIRNWFLKVEITNFGDPFENVLMARQLPDNFSDEHVQQKVLDYLHTFDPSITGFEVKKVPGAVSTDSERYEVNACHQLNPSGMTAAIPLGEESQGTLKMFSMYQKLKNVLENGGIFVIDELDSRLHPLLVRSFLQNFTNPEINRNHAQIICTMHDDWQMDSGVLRRDEIWFTEKDPDTGISELYSLADFVDENGAKIRKDEALGKNYLLGKYGAIPELESVSTLHSRTKSYR
ncbi:MAG: ATP-binding protein [Eubacterium sp.]|jgi:AAA15 family ATPase/GTPase|nr:ATP-binding protein [Eubacterium sp.]MCH4047439.1 ATP-binding protein [Eubacterium sp.]MCH4080520.1 ATP-binding protein [Eubacterium sp.]